MAKKKTTTKKKTKTTKKTRKRRATSADEAATAVLDAEVQPETDSGGKQPEAKRKKTTRKKTTRRTARPRKAAGDNGSAAVDTPVAEPQPASEEAGSPPAPPTAAEVEKLGDAIVIRFPPVAPPPFAPLPAEPEPVEAPVTVVREEVEPPPAEEAPSPEKLAPSSPPADQAETTATAAAKPVEPVQESPATLEEPAEKPAAGRKRKRRRRKTKAEREDQPAEPAETPEPAAQEPEAEPEPGKEETLSRSRKRRLRRKRRAQEAQGAPEPPTHSPQVLEPTGAPETPPPEEPARAATKAKKKRRKRGGEDPAAEPKAQPVPPPAKPAPSPIPGQAEKEMIINVVPGEECRIAILHKGKLEEIYIERASSENHVGNIYKGIVTNVEPSIQAAFIDFGQGKNGFLHISDLHPQYFPDGGQPAENVGRKMPRRNRPPIQRCLRRGQQVIVQITKEGIGTKGPTLSTYLSIPGRYLVMMPGMRQLGVSRKIEDEETRNKLRKQLSELDLPEGMGFIARTAAAGRTKRELTSDLKYLTRLWEAVTRRNQEERAPAELYRESDLMIRTIRDIFTPEIGRIIVDDPAVAQRAREFLRIFSPRSGDVVVEYTDPEPLFHKAGIEAELERLHSRHVPLKSGGSLIIEPTEALVAIDVNSGRFRTEEDAETTAYKINLEAADEIARQLRLRDLGGVIICDFIDMRQESHKRAVERRLAKNLREHKERAKILRMSQFGIIEMTRQRQRASLTRSVYQDCRYCRGTGLVKTPESVALDVMRAIQHNIIREQVKLVEVTVSQEVALQLLNRKRRTLAEMETKYNRTVSIRPDPNFGLDHVEVRCYDHRGRLVPQV